MLKRVVRGALLYAVPCLLRVTDLPDRVADYAMGAIVAEEDGEYEKPAYRDKDERPILAYIEQYFEPAMRC